MPAIPRAAGGARRGMGREPARGAGGRRRPPTSPLMRPVRPLAPLVPLLPILLLLPLSACPDRRASSDTAGATARALPTAGGDTALGGGTSTAAPLPVPGAPAPTVSAPNTPLTPGTATGGTPAATVPARSATTPAPPDAATTTTDSAPGSVASSGPSSGATSGATSGAMSGAASGAMSVAPSTPEPTSTVVAPPPPAAPPAPHRAPVPFLTGERLIYDVKFSAIDVGDGTMEVRGIEPIRGRDAYHIIFRVKGGTLVYKVNDRYESWIDVETLSSLRHTQDIDEGSYERKSTFEIFPERSVYRENQKPERPSVAEPLDDASFLYFVRTIPLEIGKVYDFPRYFRPDRNPVRIRVLRRERVKVPAGTFDAVVLQPIIKSKGLFSEGGEAQVWIADDSTRMMVQMKSKLPIGSLNLYLKNVMRGTAP